MKGRIVVANRSGVLQVPREALLNWNLEQQTADVFVARGDKAEKRVVKTGQSNGVTVEVVSGARRPASRWSCAAASRCRPATA